MAAAATSEPRDIQQLLLGWSAPVIIWRGHGSQVNRLFRRPAMLGRLGLGAVAVVSAFRRNTEAWLVVSTRLCFR
jgi:hypothetical protein